MGNRLMYCGGFLSSALSFTLSSLLERVSGSRKEERRIDDLQATQRAQKPACTEEVARCRWKCFLRRPLLVFLMDVRQVKASLQSNHMTSHIYTLQ